MKNKLKVPEISKDLKHNVQHVEPYVASFASNQNIKL